MISIRDWMSARAESHCGIRSAGLAIISVKYLHLSCPQPVYRWLRGKTLPSVDHLYALSRLFGVHMEDLLAGCGEKPVYLETFHGKEYLVSYLKYFQQKTA